MAVNLKASSSYGYELLPLFGVDTNIINAAKVGGVTVDQASPGAFVVSFKDTIYGAIPVKGQAISLAKSGSLGPASKAAWKYQFEQALVNAIAAAGEVLMEEVDYGMNDALDLPSYDPPNGVPIPPKNTTQKTAKDPLGQGSWDDPAVGLVPPIDGSLPSEQNEEGTPIIKKALNNADIMKGIPCLLAVASKCLQPVLGTSNGSIYFVTARFKGANLAVRIKGQRLSFRMEGKDLATYGMALTSLGFGLHDKYAAVHYETSDHSLVLKTIGAVIGRLGFDKMIEVADPKPLMGK